MRCAVDQGGTLPAPSQLRRKSKPNNIRLQPDKCVINPRVIHPLSQFSQTQRSIFFWFSFSHKPRIASAQSTRNPVLLIRGVPFRGDFTTLFMHLYAPSLAWFAWISRFFLRTDMIGFFLEKSSGPKHAMIRCD